MIYYIYKITNTITDMSYIGYTENFENRIHEHKSEAKRGKLQYKIYLSLREFGWDNFTKEIIYCSKDKIYTKNTMEPYFVDLYDTRKNGYNMTRGGSGTKEIIRKPLNEEQKKKISETTREGMKKIDRTILVENGKKNGKIQAERYGGKKRDAEFCKKIKDSRGFTQTDKFRNNISKSIKKAWENPEFRANQIQRLKNPSEETRLKFSIAFSGRIPWNKSIGCSPEIERKREMSKMAQRKHRLKLKAIK